MEAVRTWLARLSLLPSCLVAATKSTPLKTKPNPVTDVRSGRQSKPQRLELLYTWQTEGKADISIGPHHSRPLDPFAQPIRVQNRRNPLDNK